MNVKKERVELQDVSISELLDKGFYEKLKKNLEDLEPVTIVFIDKKTSVPILLSHQNQSEIEKRVVHVDSINETYLDNFIELLNKKKE